MKAVNSIIAAGLISILVLWGCSGTRRYTPPEAPVQVMSGTPAPGRIWVPEYVVRYDDGRYRFVRGHYRPVLFRKAHWKRSLRGLNSKGDQVNAR